MWVMILSMSALSSQDFPEPIMLSMRLEVDEGNACHASAVLFMFGPEISRSYAVVLSVFDQYRKLYSALFKQNARQLAMWHCSMG